LTSVSAAGFLGRVEFLEEQRKAPRTLTILGAYFETIDAITDYCVR
jgi:hypothetical protein